MDPPSVSIVNPDGGSPFLFIGDHAGNVIPSSLGSLGLSAGDIDRHIGWDIGVGRLGDLLADAMGAVFIRQTYSRLVVDCNRRPDAPDAIAPISDGTPVPGNQSLDEARKRQRFDEIHEPYQRAIAAEIDRRRKAGRPAILIALHSFTPMLRGGDPRPWQIGILHDGGDAGFARALLKMLREPGDLTVGDNEPYRMDGIDYTIPRHAYPGRLPYAELEIRQDLLSSRDGARSWCDRLREALIATASSQMA